MTTQDKRQTEALPHIQEGFNFITCLRCNAMHGVMNQMVPEKKVELSLQDKLNFITKHRHKDK